MYIGEVSFEVKECMPEDILYNLINSWINNGQVIETQMKIFRQIGQVNKYLIYVTIPNSNSLDRIYSNEYVENQLKILYNLGVKLSISIKGENRDIDFCRSIETFNSFVLHYDETIASPVRDFHSFIPIPLYLLPYSGTDSNYKNILDWYELSKSIYAMETWSNGAKKQLLDVNSRYNRLGREVCKSLEQKLSLPVYYYLYHYTYNTNSRLELSRKLGETGETVIDIDNENFQLVNYSERLVSQITPQILEQIR